MSERLAFRALALLPVVLGWLVVLRGLFLLPASADPALDLDAGASFGLNVAVYLPAVVLTAALLVAVPVALTARAWRVVVLLTAVTTGAFGLWVLAHDDLTAYLPGLAGSAQVAVALGTAGLLAAAVVPRRDVGEAPVRS